MGRSGTREIWTVRSPRIWTAVQIKNRSGPAPERAIAHVARPRRRVYLDRRRELARASTGCTGGRRRPRARRRLTDVSSRCGALQHPRAPCRSTLAQSECAPPHTSLASLTARESERRATESSRASPTDKRQPIPSVAVGVVSRAGRRPETDSVVLAAWYTTWASLRRGATGVAAALLA